MTEKLSQDVLKALWANAAKDGLTLTALSTIAMGYGIGADDLLNELSSRLAVDYLSGSLTYDFCDQVINGLFEAITDLGVQNGLPEPAFALYKAFDQGEWVRQEDPPGIAPGEKYTRPQVVAIMASFAWMNNGSLMEIERAAYEEFERLWYQGSFDQQRLGQAFYNHFRLHKLTNQSPLHELYEAKGEQALQLISQLFTIK